LLHETASARRRSQVQSGRVASRQRQWRQQAVVGSPVGRSASRCMPKSPPTPSCQSRRCTRQQSRSRPAAARQLAAWAARPAAIAFPSCKAVLRWKAHPIAAGTPRTRAHLQGLALHFMAKGSHQWQCASCEHASEWQRSNVRAQLSSVVKASRSN